MNRYRQNEEIAWRTIEGEAVLVEPISGVVFVLNGVGSKIWSMLEQPLSSVEIVETISVDYPSQQKIGVDVRLFLDNLTERGLIHEVAS